MDRRMRRSSRQKGKMRSSLTIGNAREGAAVVA
jgi:hypothetical protein